MGKLNALLAEANAAIPPGWDTEEETQAESAPESVRDGNTATRDEGWETANQTARADDRQGPTDAEDGERAAPPAATEPTEPEPAEGETPAPTVLKVVDPLPVLKAVERLHQGVREELRGIKDATRQQQDYLREVQRAHNAMTTEWYEIARGLPTVRAELERLQGEIAVRQAEAREARARAETELAEVRAGAEEETRAALTMQARELEAVLRRVRRAATWAVLLVALVGLLAVIAVAVVATGALQGLHLHRPL